MKVRVSSAGQRVTVNLCCLLSTMGGVTVNEDQDD